MAAIVFVMAGGPNAAFMLCLECLGRAPRVSEGMENDAYRCEVCGKGFSVDWRRGPPAEPTWPPTEQDMKFARAIQRQRNKGPGSGGSA